MSSQELSDEQRRGFCELLYHVFIELRDMQPEQTEQVRRLCWALHNLPPSLFSKDFQWEKIEGPLRAYQKQFYQDKTTTGYDYVKMVDQIRKGMPVSPL